MKLTNKKPVFFILRFFLFAFTLLGHLPSAEAQSAGTFSATGPMIAARDAHTATALKNGKVLIAGGGQFAGDSTPLASAEIYDPSIGTFSPTGSMTEARKYHTATLLSNGMVLVTGGFNLGGGFLASAELYDPATGNFTATGTMTTGHAFHTATLLGDGRLCPGTCRKVNSAFFLRSHESLFF
jgi:hypothetical protein